MYTPLHSKLLQRALPSGVNTLPLSHQAPMFEKTYVDFNTFLMDLPPIKHSMHKHNVKSCKY